MARKSHRDAVSPPATPSRRSARSKQASSAANVPPKPNVVEEIAKQETTEVDGVVNQDQTVRSTKRKRAAISYDEDATSEVDREADEVAAPSKKAKKSPRKAAAPKNITKVEESSEVKKEDGVVTAEASQEVKEESQEPNGTTVKKAKAKRKTKAEKEAEMLPLAARTIPHTHRIGAHVSAAGGVQQTVPNALHIGANAFACFLKSQRKWENPALKDEHRDGFESACTHNTYDAAAHVVPHGSYLVNLASPDQAMAEKAYNSFLDDLQRCERLGIGLYNFHPGNTNGMPRSEALARLAGRLNQAHKATNTVVTLLENMAAAGDANTIGGRFEDLADVMKLVERKDRVGVCLDTCHAFAAGYDIRSPGAYAATMAEFDRVVGGKYLRAVHLNDSKGVLGSHRDLHQNIGLGFIGLRGFWNVMNDERYHGVPMVLETPIDVKNAEGKEVEDKGIWAREIKLLEGLVGMDVEGDEFRRVDEELSEKGAAERKKLQEQYDKKQASPQKKKKEGMKKVETSDEGSE